MAITAAQVKQLRDVTGAGMMDCKKALTECNGDMDAAVEFLRKMGQAKAEKKANRIAAEVSASSHRMAIQRQRSSKLTLRLTS